VLLSAAGREEIAKYLPTNPTNILVVMLFNAFDCAAGRAEFVQYLPEATQGVVVQPLGSDGVVVVGTDTLRGLSRLDQVRVDIKRALLCDLQR
jgi:hypothetical protein